ncbi:MAG: response regulator [Planctomycetes bacterium]|nr:response regulator [Planctomycetota bacterium]
MAEKQSASATLTALIVDDEKLARDELAFLLKSFPQVEIAGMASNGLEAVDFIEKNEPDIVFMDVQMPGLDGLEAVRTLMEKGAELPRFIFATAYDQYAVDAFEVNAVDYLLKPIDKKRLAMSIERAQKLAEAPRNRDSMEQLLAHIESRVQPRTKLLVKSSNRMFLIDAGDMIYAKIVDGTITIASTYIEGHSNYKTIEELQETLKGEVTPIPEGQWIFGRISETSFPELKLPTRWDLDEATPRHPMALRLGFRLWVVNSLALKKAGITRMTPDPQGGKIARDERGVPNGVLREPAAQRMVGRLLPPSPRLEDETARRNVRAFLRELVSLGITSINVAGLRPGNQLRWVQDSYQRWGEELPRMTVQLQVRPGSDGHDDIEEGVRDAIRDIEGMSFHTGFGNDRLKLGDPLRQPFAGVVVVGVDGVCRRRLDPRRPVAHGVGLLAVLEGALTASDHAGAFGDVPGLRAERDIAPVARVLLAQGGGFLVATVGPSSEPVGAVLHAFPSCWHVLVLRSVEIGDPPLRVVDAPFDVLERVAIGLPRARQRRPVRVLDDVCGQVRVTPIQVGEGVP